MPDDSMGPVFKIGIEPYSAHPPSPIVDEAADLPPWTETEAWLVGYIADLKQTPHRYADEISGLEIVLKRLRAVEDEAMPQSPSSIVDEVADSRTTREKYEGERSAEWFAIFDVLRDYRMSNMVFDGTDEPFCLVDLMSNDGTSIATGEEEIATLADEISLALTSPPKAGAGEPVAWMLQQHLRDGTTVLRLPALTSRKEADRYAERNPDETLVALYTTPEPRRDGVRVTDEVLRAALETWDKLAGYGKMERMRAALEGALNTGATNAR